jgi:hypothetical protein
MTMLVVWTIAFWAILFGVGFRFVRRRKVLALVALPVAALIAAGLEFFAPPIGGYDPIAARFWMSRAAAESDAATKEAHVRRVAFASPEFGWFVASQAIDHVEPPLQRCRLRTILAGLPGIRNQQKLGGEARDECNAVLLERRP